MARSDSPADLQPGKARRITGMASLLVLTVLLAACSSLPSLPPEPPTLAPEDNHVRMDWSARFLDGWQPGQGAVRLSPVLDDDTLYAAHSDGQVRAFDKRSGRERWRQHYEPWQAGITKADGQLYLINQAGDLVTLDATDGTELQRSELGVTTLTPSAVSGNRVAILGQDGSLRLWDIANQSWVWINESEQPSLTLHGQASPIIVDNAVIAGFANGRLASYSLQSGELRWAHRLSDPRGSTDLQRIVDVDAQPVMVNGDLYAGAYEGRLVRVSADSGNIGWQVERSVTASLATDGQSVFVATRSGEVYAYDLSNQGERWHQQAYAGRPITGLSVTGEALVMTDRRGYVFVLSTRTGDTLGRLNFRGSQNFTVPAVTDEERFYLQSMQGLISGNSIRLLQE